MYDVSIFNSEFYRYCVRQFVTLYKDLDIIESRVEDDMDYDDDIASVFYGKMHRKFLFTLENAEGRFVLKRNRNLKFKISMKNQWLEHSSRYPIGKSRDHL